MRRTLSSGIELAIGEGARATEAKLDVAFKIEFAGLIEMSYGFGAALRIVAALNKQGSKACTRQDESAKKSCTACAYHHGTLVGRLREHCWKCKFFGLNAFDMLGYRFARKLMQQVLLGSQSAAKCKAIREYQYDVIALSCVNGAAM